MPTHAAGDLLVMFACNTGATTLPTVPSGWATIGTRQGSGMASVIATKVAASASETAGTWTNATTLAVHVSRHSVNHIVVGAVSHNNRSGNVAIDYLTLVSSGAMNGQQRGVNWCIGFAAATLNSTDMQTAPSGMTNRTSAAGASSREITVHDTNGDTTWATTTYTASGAVSSHTAVVEIWDTGIAKSSGGGASLPLIGGKGLVY